VKLDPWWGYVLLISATQFSGTTPVRLTERISHSLIEEAIAPAF
jgi:hypothetical protein